MARTVILWLALFFVVGSWASIEWLNHVTGHPIERQASMDECRASGGTCKWRVRACPPADWFVNAPGREHLRCTPQQEILSRREFLLRDLAFFPGLLVYPVAVLGGASAAVAARSRPGALRRAGLFQAFTFLGILARFYWLGVFTAVFVR